MHAEYERQINSAVRMHIGFIEEEKKQVAQLYESIS